MVKAHLAVAPITRKKAARLSTRTARDELHSCSQGSCGQGNALKESTALEQKSLWEPPTDVATEGGVFSAGTLGKEESHGAPSSQHGSTAQLQIRGSLPLGSQVEPLEHKPEHYGEVTLIPEADNGSLSSLELRVAHAICGMPGLIRGDHAIASAAIPPHQVLISTYYAAGSCQRP